VITSLLLLAASQPQTVTFTHGVNSAERVLAAFGEQIGEEIKPAGSVEKDYFLVRFVDVPVDEAKAKIAEVLNATWTRKGDTVYLDRTEKQEQQDKSGDKKALSDSLKVWAESRPTDGDYLLETAISQIDQAKRLIQTRSPEQRGLLENLQVRSPIGRFATRLVREKADVIAEAVLADGHIVFNSTDQIGVQSLKDSPAFKLYELEQTSLDRAYIAAGPSLEDLSFSTNAPALVGRETENRLRVEITSDARLISVTFKGSQVLYRPSMAWNSLALEPAPKEVKESTRSYKFELEASELLAADYYSLIPDPQQYLGEAKHHKPIQRPSKNEVLDVLLSGLLSSAATSLESNAVCLISDRVGLHLNSLLGFSKEDGFWNGLASNLAPHHVEFDDGWLTITPSFRADTRQERFDRKKLEQFIKAFQKDGLTLDIAAEMAGTSDQDQLVGRLVSVAAYALQDYHLPGAMHKLTYDLLRLYDRLPLDAKSESRIRDVYISAPSRDEAADKIAARFFLGGAAAKSKEPGRLFWQEFSQRSGWGNGVPTELAEGLPAGSRLRFRVNNYNLLTRHVGGSSYNTRPVEFVARAQASIEEELRWSSHPDFHSRGRTEAQSKQILELFRNFQFSLGESLLVELQAPGTGFYTGRTGVQNSSGSPNLMPLESLPKEIQAEYQEWLTHHRAEQKRIYEQMYGGSR
jgi:hypothetical protein